jgi:uncharacterized membrane protein YoaK (UPF0700 family)
MDAATGIVDDQAPLVRALIGLTVVTGLVAAISFLGLGHTFTANMTANVVFLGFAAGGAPGISAARSIAALCAFAGGSVCGGRLISSRERTPIAHLLITTYVELALLLTAASAAAFAAGDASLAADSSLAGGHGGRSERRALSMLAMFAGALVGAMLLRTFGLPASLR